MVTEKPIDLDLTKDLEDEEFRKHFSRSLAQMEVAEQIVKMRNKRDMRQIDLADLTEMKQSAISRIEQADYASWNFQTLLRIAEALRARLHIRLEPIEDVVNESKHIGKSAADGNATGTDLMSKEQSAEHSLTNIATSQDGAYFVMAVDSARSYSKTTIH